MQHRKGCSAQRGAAGRGSSARNPWESGLLPPKHQTARLGLVVAFFVLGLLPGLAGTQATAPLPTERLLQAARIPVRRRSGFGMSRSMLGFPVLGFRGLFCVEDLRKAANQQWCSAGCRSLPRAQLPGLTGLRTAGLRCIREGRHCRAAGSQARERSELQNSIAVMPERVEGLWFRPFRGPPGPSNWLSCSIPGPHCTAQ